jgi:hypothetical protein
MNLSPLDSIAGGFDALMDGEAPAGIDNERSERRAGRRRLYLRFARDEFHLPGLPVAKGDLHTAASERGIGTERRALELATEHAGYRWDDLTGVWLNNRIGHAIGYETVRDHDAAWLKRWLQYGQD